MPPYSWGAAIPTQPPSAMARKPSPNPSGVRTTPFSSRDPCTSPTRCSGASTSSQSLPASARIAATVSSSASAKRAVAVTCARSTTFAEQEGVLRDGGAIGHGRTSGGYHWMAAR